MQKLAPVWEQLAQSLEFEPSVSVAKLDCTQYRTVCNNFDVKGYPTLLWIEDGKRVDKYQGQRSHDDLKSYVNRMMGSSEEKSSEESKSDADNDWAVGVLTGDSFPHGIEKGVAFVKFFAPWYVQLH